MVSLFVSLFSSSSSLLLLPFALSSLPFRPSPVESPLTEWLVTSPFRQSFLLLLRADHY